MRKFTWPLPKFICVLLLICLAKVGKSQAPPVPTLKLTDFAIWGGSASPNSYNSTQRVYLKEKVSIQGNIGSNHIVEVKENFTLTGSILSGNGVSLKENTKITGDIFANKKAANFQGDVISGKEKSNFIGNLVANGKIVLKTGSGSDATKITGKVAVPAPAATNYSGPVPSGGIVTVFTLPVLPVMPNNTPFDSQVGTTNITNTQDISPGKYRNLALTGNKTLTFKGPGNYIFNEVDNGSNSNKFVFDFNNTSAGTISIFIIKDARWGKLSVSTKNGNFPSRIYTEIHGNGTFSFDLQGPDAIPAGSYAWLGNVWAPNGGISIKSLKTSTNPHIIGALWSGKRVDLEENLRLVYQAPAADPIYIDPYYPPPVSGKVNPANNIIGAELFSLFQNPAPINSITENEIFILDNSGKVMIEVVSKTANDNTLKADLIALGMTSIVDNGPHIFVITGFFPINNLPQLNGNARIEYVRPLYPAISNAGQVTTQGDSTMRSHNVRGRFGVDGSGVKIGVISDSYNSKLVAQNDVDQGDLPGIKSGGQLNDNPEPVQVLEDLPQRGNDEGRAMLQIVHDVAPKSKLAFRTGFLTAGHFAKGIQELADPYLAGGPCDVIVDDITYVTEPFLQDGKVAQAVDQVAAQGVTYFSSAGNFGNKSYESVFNGVTNTSVIATGQIHQFGGAAADIYQTVNLKPGSYTIVLQWSDEFHSLGSADGVQTDMDLYLVGANGYTLFGFNRSNLFGDPFEVCPFTVKEETLAKLMVVRAAGINNVRFKYIIFRGDATIQDYPSGTSTIVGHPNANGAIAVGAMLYANFPAFTPVWPGVASFSSRGGTSTLQNNVFTIRNKPELIGPNGVNTTVNLGGAAFNDGDPYPNFFGTSAAAPHAAAVGALLIQGRKKYNLQTSVSPDEIRQQLQSSTGKFSYLPANFSFEGGYGYIQADSAIAQIANARPIISSLEAVVPGAQNGTEPFEVKVKGEYLTSSTEIYYYGEPVTTSVSLDKTEATATVPAIPNGEDPPFQLYNPPKSPSELDGGLSEALHFFSSVIDITVRAENKSRKYGQNNPVFSVEILYNGVPVNHPDTLAKLKLDGNNLSFNTIATLASNAGLYGIFPSRSTPLEGNDPLITQYGFTFVSGTLSVGKMPLTITPDNKTVYSGEDPGEITYEYALDQSDATSPTLPDEVRALHKKYLADNALMVLNDFNNQNLDFSNMSIMASFQAVRNARKFHLENGQLFPLRGDLDPTELGRQRFIVDASATSLQNYQLDPAQSYMVPAFPDGPARAFLNIKALANGTAKAAVPNGQLQPMVNGQLMAMVNGQLQAIVNGQLQALVNGQLMPLVNGQLVAMVNGQLQPLVNGQLLAMVNGQLMALVNGELQLVQDLALFNGQLQALVNGQLQPLVNGQLQAMVNGVVTDIPNADVNLVNGQLQAIVNGQLQALVNGQLQALVNGQLQPLVNGDAVSVESVIQLANGQLQALVNGTYIPITNGQLQALVNGQLLAMVNGQLMAIVNGEVTFTVFQNGQLQALVNGQLQPLVNGQLQAIVNGQLQALVNSESPVDNSYRIVNGQLQAIVNGQTWAYANGQLLALVNGQLQPLINNFDVSGPNNNANTLVLVDEDDINLQAGGIGGMFSMNMITGLDTGTQHLVPGAFVNENFEVTYGLGEVTIITKPTLTVSADNKTKIQGEPNPPLTLSYEGFLNGDDENTICSGDFVPAYTVPASPVSIEQLSRVTTYTNVALNNGTNVITVSPGATVTLTGNRSSISQAISENQCPGCVTQHYIGIRDVFSDCFDANGSSGVLNHTFKAPKIPGVYYITQVASWEYNCFDNGQGNPDNDPENAIAVVIVEGINKMYAATSASTISPADGYPITLSGCTDPTNYNVVFNDGILTIQEDPCLERHWDANRTYTDRMSGAAGIATGGVHNLGPGKVGGVSTWNGYYNQNNSFSFDGTGYIETGTAGSVSGTDDFSVSAWVQTTSNDPMVIINQRGSDNDVFGSGFYGGYILKIGGAHSDSTPNSNAGKAYFLIFDLNNNPNLVDLFSTTLVNDGNWHHIKAERRGTSINLYVDGNLEATASTPGAVYLNGAIPTYIGADVRDDASYFNGLIDEVKVAICSTYYQRPGNKSIPVTTSKIKPADDKLYPNPASASVRLQLTNNVKSVNDIQLFDVVGKMKPIPLRRINDGLYELDISRLANGIYFIKTKATAGFRTFTFIKM